MLATCEWVGFKAVLFWFFGVFFKFLSLLLHLPAEQFHEVLEAILSKEIKGALGRAEVDEQENEQDDGQEWN